MVTVTGKPINISGVIDTTSTLDFALCGYGSQIPRAIGSDDSVGTFSDATIDGVQGEAPFFSIQLIGNDLIAPAGTYYTVTIRNENGDILQVNAYRFLDGHTYDLDYTDPYDPNQPPPPLPPLLSDNLEITDGVFDGGEKTTWKITLTEDMIVGALLNILPGNLYTFIIVQDAVGGHFFLWPSGPPPANLFNGPYVNEDPNATTIQTFVADENSQLYPIGPATYYP